MSHIKVTLLLPGFVLDAGFSHLDESLALFSFSQDPSRQPWQAQLANLLGLDTEGGAYLPGAKLGLLDNDDPSLPDNVMDLDIVRADPISLKADRDSATLISPEQLDLSDKDAATLISSLNDFVAEDGLRFFSGEAGQWYMSGWSAESLKSFPPSFLANRNASTFLPEGEGSARWRRLMTEIQMLLHSHQINQQREQRGLLPVNSVWFWGGAPLPQARNADNELMVFADEPQAQSLAKQLGISYRPLMETANAAFDSDVVVVDLQLIKAWLDSDSQRLEHEFARIAQQWLQPLSRQVANGQVQQVQLLTEDGLQGVCNRQTLASARHAPDGLLKRLIGFFQR